MWSNFVEKELNNDIDHDELLNELYKQMFIVAYSKMHNKTDALDIVQESWVKILNKIHTLQDKDKLMQWAKTIVSNTAINLLKKRNTMEKLFDSNKEMEVEVEDPLSFEHINNDNLIADELYESIKQLDLDTRKVFLYKFSYGWKDQQIADELQLPLGTVKAKLHRGKERLRKILQQKQKV